MPKRTMQRITDENKHLFKRVKLEFDDEDPTDFLDKTLEDELIDSFNELSLEVSTDTEDEEIENEPKLKRCNAFIKRPLYCFIRGKDDFVKWTEGTFEYDECDFLNDFSISFSPQTNTLYINTDKLITNNLYVIDADEINKNYENVYHIVFDCGDDENGLKTFIIDGELYDLKTITSYGETIVILNTQQSNLQSINGKYYYIMLPKSSMKKANILHHFTNNAKSLTSNCYITFFDGYENTASFVSNKFDDKWKINTNIYGFNCFE